MATHPTLRRLNAEWAGLAGHPVPPGWAGEPVLAGQPDLAAVLAGVRERPDELLAALLRRGDATACRIVLQAMLGRAVLDAARDRDHDLDDYVGELWLAIATYPLQRRPARIAANLALDTAKRVRRRSRATPVDPARLATLSHSAWGAAERVALVLARARRVALLDDTSHAALCLVYTGGVATAEAAALLGLTPSALRQRCHRAVRRLAAHADALGEAIG